MYRVKSTVRGPFSVDLPSGRSAHFRFHEDRELSDEEFQGEQVQRAVAKGLLVVTGKPTPEVVPTVIMTEAVPEVPRASRGRRRARQG